MYKDLLFTGLDFLFHLCQTLIAYIKTYNTVISVSINFHLNCSLILTTEQTLIVTANFGYFNNLTFHVYILTFIYVISYIFYFSNYFFIFANVFLMCYWVKQVSHWCKCIAVNFACFFIIPSLVYPKFKTLFKKTCLPNMLSNLY